MAPISARPADLQALAVLPFEVLDVLDLPAQYERSFKLRPAQLLAQRYLLGVPASGRPSDVLVDVACRLGMPAAARPLFERALQGASMALYGLEAGSEEVWFKAYAEHRARLAPVLHTPHGPRGDVPAPAVEMFRGFKWRADAAPDDACVQTVYTARPGQSLARLRAAVDACLIASGAGRRQAGAAGRVPGGRALSSAGDADANAEAVRRGGLLGEIVHAVLDRALAACPGRLPLWLDLAEAGEPVRAFDLNLYDAGLRVQDIAAEVSSLARAFGIGDDPVYRLMRAAGGAALGHVSAGRGRDGQPYLTVYFEPPAQVDGRLTR